MTRLAVLALLSTSACLFTRPTALPLASSETRSTQTTSVDGIEIVPLEALTEKPNCEPIEARSVPISIYPEAAREAGVEGTVRARIVLDSRGKQASVEILSHPGYGLDVATRRLLLDPSFLRCGPGTFNGRPVATVIPFTYFWELGE